MVNSDSLSSSVFPGPGTGLGFDVFTLPLSRLLMMSADGVCSLHDCRSQKRKGQYDPSFVKKQGANMTNTMKMPERERVYFCFPPVVSSLR